MSVRGLQLPDNDFLDFLEVFAAIYPPRYSLPSPSAAEYSQSSWRDAACSSYFSSCLSFWSILFAVVSALHFHGPRS